MGIIASQASFLCEEAQNLPKMHKDYLYSMKKNMRDTFLTIESNPHNTRIATEKKNFERTLPVRMSNTSALKKNVKIHWKEYLISYFKKQEEKDIAWYSEIRTNIQKEAFFKENYYLSDMFYQSYEMQMKPSCLKESDRQMKPLDQFEAIEQKLNRRSISRKSSAMDNKLDLTHVTENLGGSFCDTDEMANEEGVFYKSARGDVKDYVKIFKAHVIEPSHPIHKVIQIFEAKVSKVIDNKITQLKAMKKDKDAEFESMLNDVCDGFVHVIQKFVIKTQSALKLMYAETINLQCFFEEKDEIINIVCSVLFSKGNIYEKIYELFSMQLKKSLSTFEEKITQLADVTPKDIEINVKYCLDESTAKLKQEIYETESKKKLSKPPTVILSQSSELSINYVSELKESSHSSLREKILKSESSELPSSSSSKQQQKRSKVKVYDTFHNSHPIEGYKTAITIMKSIKFNKVPFEKMMLLASVSTEITDCITSFWSGMDQYLPSSLLCLNADDLMHIFIFIVIKTQMPELLVQERIIEKFTTTRSRSTTMGYYTTVLEGSLEYIERETIKGIGRKCSKKKSNKERDLKIKDEEDSNANVPITILPFSMENN